MKYPYEDLSPKQFEDLVVALCQFLLGAGVQGFATGPDGGRDAKFMGTAELLPSKTQPWQGTVIVQAKHTNGYNTTYSDADFYSAESDETVLGKELPRIRALKASNELDHYVLFSNRRLTGNAEPTLRKVISGDAGIPGSSIGIYGIEQLELWLKRFPEAARIANINPLDSPLLVSPDDLAEVVEHLAAQIPTVPPPVTPPTDRVTYERKNRLNNMTAEYALSLRKLYLKETQQIREFLAAPENDRLLSLYQTTVEEFQLQVIAKRKDHHTFDEVINYIFDLLFARDPILRKHKRLTRAVVFYMYWNCDLGMDADASA